MNALDLVDPYGLSRRTIRLTDRWTPLKPHEEQQLFFWHPARFKINPSGRRSGKTELCKRKAVLQLVRRRKWPTRVFLGAPSLGQAKEIFWEDIKALTPKHWIAKIRESSNEIGITTHWGAQIRILGLDKGKRVEGIPWDWGCVDEIADCAEQCFTLNIGPALSTLGREGSCDLIGVPDEVGRNQEEYEKLWEIGMQWPHKDKDICSFHWGSDEILDPAEIEAVKSRMDPLQYAQEYLGLFVRSGGKALPNYNTILHVRDDYAQYSPFLRLDFSMDFGVGANAAGLLLQASKGQVWVFNEIESVDGSTEVLCNTLLERCQERSYSLARLGVYGDAAGNHRSSPTGDTDYDIVAQKFRGIDIEWNQLTAPPSVKDTLNATRGRLVTADNVVHLHVHSRCTRLIEDMKNAPWPSDLRKYHFLAALRYYCYRRFVDTGGTIETGGLSMPNLGGKRR